MPLVHTVRPIFSNYSAPTSIYTLSLHDALPIYSSLVAEHEAQLFNYMFMIGIQRAKLLNFRPAKVQGKIIATSLTQEQRRRSEEHTSELQSLTNLVCRLLLEKKKKH